MPAWDAVEVRTILSGIFLDYSKRAVRINQQKNDGKSCEKDFPTRIYLSGAPGGTRFPKLRNPNPSGSRKKKAKGKRVIHHEVESERNRILEQNNHG